MSSQSFNNLNEEPFGLFSPNKNLAASKTWVSPQGSKIDTYFETSQGSKYLRTEKGETKRWKKEHSNDWDFGLKDWFSNSLFVPESEEKFANAGQFLFSRGYKVALANAGNKKVFVIFDGGWRPAKWKDSYPTHAQKFPEMAEKILGFSFIEQPRKGYNVVEYNFKPNGSLQSYHFGSPVSKVMKFSDLDDENFKLFFKKFD
jgi:hypothetical protein